MKNIKKLLIIPLYEQSQEDAAREAIEQLSLLPELKTKWLKIQGMDQENYEFLEELQDFHSKFASCWLLSSPETIDCFGVDICFDMFELASKWKNVVWDIESIQFFEDIPEEPTVFRGGNGSIEEVCSGHSWTLSFNTALTYAGQPDGIVISAQLSKSDILLLITLEREIIPRKGSLKDIKLVSKNKQNFYETDLL